MCSRNQEVTVSPSGRSETSVTTGNAFCATNKCCVLFNATAQLRRSESKQKRLLFFPEELDQSELSLRSTNGCSTVSLRNGAVLCVKKYVTRCGAAERCGSCGCGCVRRVALRYRMLENAHYGLGLAEATSTYARRCPCP